MVDHRAIAIVLACMSKAYQEMCLLAAQEKDVELVERAEQLIALLLKPVDATELAGACVYFNKMQAEMVRVRASMRN